MKKKFKTTIILASSVIVLALLAHLTKTYLVPFIVHMHSGEAY